MRKMCHPTGLFSGLLMLCIATIGCGGKISTRARKLTSINVFPVTATVDHIAVPPGNTQHFDAFDSSSTPGCVTAQGNLTTATAQSQIPPI
jgi:hypothetical protein